MSRIFSVSLITLLLMMSVLGTARPVGVAATADATPPVVEVAPETSSEDASAVASETAEPTASVTAETTAGVAAEPASDMEQQTPASENAAGETSPGMIVPNAVDPNPGECPVDEICDGGGGGGGATVVSIPFSAFGANGNLTNATIEVFDASGTSLGAQVTGDDGVALFDLMVGTTYTVNMSAPGFQTLSGLQVLVTSSTTSVNYYLDAQPGTAMFTVLDQATGAPIHSASVVFTDDPDGDYQTQTDENGVISFADLEPGTYSFTVSNPGYAPQVISVTVTSGQNSAITVELVQAGSPWTITIVNSVTGAPVSSASIWIRDAVTGDEFNGETNASGVWVSPRIVDGDYIITVHHDAYVNIQDLTVAKTSDSAQVEMQPYQQGRVALTVVDLETGAPIANAQITIMYSSQPVSAVYGTTNASGQWTSGVLPGGEHQLNIHADGYDFERDTVTIVDGTASYEIKMQPREYGRFTFVVIDQETGNAVQGAHITITLRGGVYLIGSGETNSDGVWVGPTSGWAEYQYTISKPGYKTFEKVTFVKGQPFSRTVYMERGTAHDVQISVNMPAPASSTLLALPGAGVNAGLMPVYAQVSGDLVPLAGASISISDPYTNEVLHTGTTGSDGTITIAGVYEGQYRLVIMADGMETHIQAITVGDGTGVDITMFPAEPEVPTDPEPGDGDGNGDGDGTNPGTENPDTGTNPGTGGGDGDGTNPGTDNPDTGSNPGTDGGNVGTNPGTGNPNAGTNTGTDDAGSGAENAERAMSPSVDKLPSTGSGPMQSTVMITAVMIAAGLGLISTAIRRLAR